MDALGLGLTGARGAIIFFSTVVGSLALMVALYEVFRRVFRRRAIVERFLLFVPAVGPTLRALAISRLCMAGRLMLETSLSILKTLKLAFMATDNAAFISSYPQVESSLKQGNSIASSFGKARIFPEKFLSAVGVGEESGRLPETLRYQAEEFDDEARRRMRWMTQLAGWAVWLFVAVLVIFCIYRIFTNVYLKNIEQYLPTNKGPGPARVIKK